MKFFKGMVLSLGIPMMFVLIRGVKMETERVCSNENVAKLSMMSGISQTVVMMETRIGELETTVYKSVKEKNATLQTKKDLLAYKKNISTPQLEEMESSYHCDHVPVNDCCQIKRMLPSAKSGVYAIKDPCSGYKPFSLAKLAIYCDMETDGGGWIVIQRRNASMGWVNFTRNWADYENGFGDLDGEFWIGLKNIHEFSVQHQMKLKITVWNDSRTPVTWNYPHFQIDGPNNNYAVSRTVTTGTGDGSYGVFPYNSDISRGSYWRHFSTYDRDNDRLSSINCAYSDQAGWWYYNCDYANLNGRHHPSLLPGTRMPRQRLVWKTASGYEVYTHSEMKIRPKLCV